MKHLILGLLLLYIAIPNTLGQDEYYFPPLLGDTWETTSPESLGWCLDKIDPLYTYLDNNNTKAFIVLKDGKIVLEQYFAGFHADSAWYWASAGKGITAFLTGIAQEEGFLDIDHPSSLYLGEGWSSMTPAQEEAITILNQLTMTSGLEDDIPDNFCTDPECLIYRQEPNTRWSYHNAPYTLLDQVLEEATGVSMNLYMNYRIKTYTGMTGLFVPVGYNNVYFSNARSMARFGSLMLNEGTWNETVVLDDPAYFSAMTNTSQDLNKSYGYLWWLNGKESFKLPQTDFVFSGGLLDDAPSDMYAAIGKNGQYLNIVPSQNLLVIRMGENPSDEDALVPTVFNNKIWQYLNDLMCEDANVAEYNPTKESTVYPNPFTDVLNIQANEYEYYKVIDITGKEVQNGTLSKGNNLIDTQALKQGVYYLQINNENGSRIEKIIRQ